MLLQASHATGFPDLTDIDVDETGGIVAVSEEGWVIVGDSSLNDFSWFRAIDDLSASMFFVTFAPLTPAPVRLASVVSEKTHGAAGTFGINLPIDGTRGVECRSGDRTAMVFTFEHNLLQVGSLCAKGGIVTGAAIDKNDARRYIVNLKGVENASYVTVTLTGVHGSEGTYSETVSQEMGVLIGDTGGEGSVTSGDVNQTMAQIGQPVTISNFRQDVSINGYIKREDLTLVTSQIGTALPSSP
jgi:hypothetical protein